MIPLDNGHTLLLLRTAKDLQSNISLKDNIICCRHWFTSWCCHTTNSDRDVIFNAIFAME